MKTTSHQVPLSKQRHPKTMLKKPNCWECRFFKITHRTPFPYACEVMGFKSRQLPCLEVLRIDGRECRRFAPKTGREIT